MVENNNETYDLSVSLGNFKLDNPVIPASGTFGFGYEFKDFFHRTPSSGACWCDKLSFFLAGNAAPDGRRASFGCRGCGLPRRRPSERLLAMTVIFDHFCTILGANKNKFVCHCEPVRTLAWQSVLLIAKQCVAPSGRQRYPSKR